MKTNISPAVHFWFYLKASKSQKYKNIQYKLIALTKKKKCNILNGGMVRNQCDLLNWALNMNS